MWSWSWVNCTTSLQRHGIGVEAEDLLHHQRVGDAVRDMVERAGTIHTLEGTHQVLGTDEEIARWTSR